MTETNFKKSTDERMFIVMDYIAANRIKGIASRKVFAETIGYLFTNLSNIRTGGQSFGIDHISECCKIYNVSADYIFGFTNDMFRNGTSLPAISRLKDAVREIEEELKNKKLA